MCCWCNKQVSGDLKQDPVSGLVLTGARRRRDEEEVSRSRQEVGRHGFAADL